MSRRKNERKLALYLLLAGILAVAAVAAYYWYASRFGSAYAAAIASQNASNVCTPPQGYTQEQWQQHISHHPDQYAKCFNQSNQTT